MAYTVGSMQFQKMRFPKISLRLFNNCLSILVAGLAVYIIALPFLPGVGWWVRHDSPITVIVRPKPNPAPPPPAEQVIAGDMLFIPSLELEQTIYGGGKGALSKGVWHVPHTSTPGKGSNTVLVGHRFTYKNPNGVFYHLDKVKTGDPITVHWEGKAYAYAVKEIKVVPAAEVAIENATAEPQLTIYTCTPLWSVSHRLVVIAMPVERDA